ncbi:MAG: hypothetical protein OQJ78_09740, partial [Ignavibacteriaceae bacterium]|nr:hypothetical protein [Ignavibacteriaceae bacterium]
MFNKPKAQRMVFEAEQPYDPNLLKNYFAETPSGEPQGELLISTGSPGYMVKSPVPDNEYNYKITHYTASFILKKTPATTGNPEVVRLEAICKDDGSILNQRILYNNDFSGNDLETKTLEFDLTYNPNPELEPQYKTSTCVEVDIRVYWYGNVTTWLDKVIIEDDLGVALFSHQYDSDLLLSALSFQSYPLMKRFYFFDEPYLSSFLAYKYVDDVIPDEIPGITTINQSDKLERFLLDAQPLELMIDPYSITSSIPSPAFISNADSFGIAPYISDEYYTTTLQNALQGVYIDKVSYAASLTIPNGKNFYVVPQLHGKYFEKNGKFISPSGLISPLRPPTGNEVAVQCNLAIAYGAKGIIPYCLTTERIDWDGKTNFPGLLTPDADINGIYRNHWTNYGLFLWNTDQNTTQQKLIWMGYKDKWDALANVNAKLTSIGSTLIDLTWKNTYSIHLGQPTGEYITSVTTIDAADKRYIELGLFNKAGEVSSEYFYIVNRRTLLQDSREIEVQYDRTNTNPYNFNNWTVKEIGTENYWSSGNPANQFTIIYQPGDGKLFKLQPTVIGGGRLYHNEVIQSDIELKHDLIIESGVKLEVYANYHCYG